MKSKQFPARLSARPVSKYEDTPQAARARLLRADPKNLTQLQAALLRTLNRAVMPIYLLHQPVLAVALLGLAPLALAAPIERLALIALTAGGSWCVYRALDGSSLRILLGLSPPPRPPEGLQLPAYAGLRAAGD
jgi:peptidoglycan/LPS O-acetylase OafA/YrhL